MVTNENHGQRRRGKILLNMQLGEVGDEVCLVLAHKPTALVRAEKLLARELDARKVKDDTFITV